MISLPTQASSHGLIAGSKRTIKLSFLAVAGICVEDSKNVWIPASAGMTPSVQETKGLDPVVKPALLHKIVNSNLDQILCVIASFLSRKRGNPGKLTILLDRRVELQLSSR